MITLQQNKKIGCSIQGIAKCYLRGGFSIVPLKSNAREPKIRWKDYTKQKMNTELVQDFFTEGSNIAIVSGEVSGITVLDIDDMEKFRNFYPEIKKTETTVVKSPNGWHYWFQYEKNLKSKQYQRLGFDLKNDNCLITAPPSVRDGVVYNFLKVAKLGKMPEDLKEKILKLQKDEKSTKDDKIDSKLLNIILDKLEGKKIQIRNGYLCLCPAHADHNPSLSVTVRDGQIALKCYAGCTVDEVLRAIGLTRNDLSIYQEFTQDEIEQAEKMLRSATLLDDVIKILNGVYIGRDLEKKLLFLVSIFRKLDVSTCCLIVGDSSVGKSSLVDAIANTIPDEENLKYTYSSEKFFLYYQGELRGKVLTIFELQGASALPFLKTFLSEGESALGTVIKEKKELRAVEIRKDTRGLVLFVTTTPNRLKLDEELFNRSFVVNLDFQPELLKDVFLMNAEKKPKNSLRILKVLQSLIKPATVIIPYLNALVEAFPTDKPRRARDFEKVITLIKAHSLLHQYQREKDSEGRIIATLEDYRAIYDLQELITESICDLPKHLIDFLKFINPSKKKKDIFEYPKSRRTIYLYLKTLFKNGYIIEREDEIAITEKPIEIKLLPPPDVIYSLIAQLQNNAQTVDTQGFALCNIQIAQDCTVAQNCNQAKEPTAQECNSVQLCKSVQNGDCTDKLLKNKEKYDLCNCATGDYISDHADIDLDDVEVLEDSDDC